MKTVQVREDRLRDKNGWLLHNVLVNGHVVLADVDYLKACEYANSLMAAGDTYQEADRLGKVYHSEVAK